MSETGVIKFRAERLAATMQPCASLAEFNLYRGRLRELGFIGQDAHKIGFGNISLRPGNGEGFFITISGSSVQESLQLSDLVFIRGWNFDRNFVQFEGSGTPSAETLTHAAIYQGDPSAGAVVHVHAPAIWNELMARGDATQKVAEYGTPDMARSVQQFVEQRAGLTNIFAMSGHEDGVLAFGRTLPDACQKILDAASRQP